MGWGCVPIWEADQLAAGSPGHPEASHPEGPSTQAGSGVGREGSPGPFKMSHCPHIDSKGCVGTGAFPFWLLSLHDILDYCHNIRS